ncbi:MAG: UDP-N-acetylmuramoyl-L-alanine--D-glutamate ligase, partial [bacterium]|nr:UDP-N-acetylmuramoyl-L-alanine--D-glutamate ligase [bacterium]
ELGVKKTVIHEVIKTFENLPYRLQQIRELNGVKYFNDSYSTTPETSMAAVDSFEEPTILIAGGYDKGLSYNEWALKILTKPNLHTVILMGDTTEKMEEALIRAEERLGDAEGSATRILRRDKMEEAVVEAYAESEEGGVVVLSPAAASFDMYQNYKERGNDFMAQVRKLK